MKRPSNETVTADGVMVTGVNTRFTETFKDGDKLRFRGKSEQLKVRNGIQVERIRGNGTHHRGLEWPVLNRLRIVIRTPSVKLNASVRLFALRAVSQAPNLNQASCCVG